MTASPAPAPSSGPAPAVEASASLPRFPDRAETLALAERWVSRGPAECVVLIGSHARGDAGPASPVDVACIVDGERARAAMRRVLFGPSGIARDSALVCVLVATRAELSTGAHSGNALGAVLADGVVLAGVCPALADPSPRLAPPDALADLLASAMESLGPTWRVLPGARAPLPPWLAAWDAGCWALARVRAGLRPHEPLAHWHARRATRLALVGAEQVARLVAAGAGLAPTGVRFLGAQMGRVAAQVPSAESGRLAALGAATRPVPGSAPRTVAVGAHDGPDALLARLTGAYGGLAWWLRHGGRTAGGRSDTGRVAATLASDRGRLSLERWLIGEAGRHARACAPPSLDDALAALEARLP